MIPIDRLFYSEVTSWKRVNTFQFSCFWWNSPLVPVTCSLGYMLPHHRLFNESKCSQKASLWLSSRVLSVEDFLEKEMKTHSTTPAWEILWTEEPGRLQSMGSQNSQTGLSDWATARSLEEPGPPLLKLRKTILNIKDRLHQWNVAHPNRTRGVTGAKT